MEFSVEFYKTQSGRSPVQDFLDDLKTKDPDDFHGIRNKASKIPGSDLKTALSRKEDWEKRNSS
jgi:hypothetical protein